MRKRILVVDDDPILRAGMEQILAKQEYQVQTAGSGPEGIEFIPQFQPDLIISDISMPEMDGIAFYRQVRATAAGKNTPFLFLATPQETLPQLPGLRLPASLSKPFGPEALLDIVQEKLDQAVEPQVVKTVSLSTLSPELLSPFFHEFRTSLTMIKTTIALLTNPSISYGVEEMREFLDIVRRGGDRVDRLVRDFLAILKLESKVAEQEAREADWIEDYAYVIDRAIQSLQIDINEQDVTIRTAVTEDLPSIPILEEHLQTILEKLLQNAIKFSRGEGKDISIEALQDQDGVRFVVTDQGIGIPKEERVRIFDQFSQLSRAGLERQGAGLGLAVARGLVELYGGKIWVESQVDVGSAFSFYMPSVRVIPEPAPPLPAEPTEEDADSITAEEAFRRMGITFGGKGA